MQDRLVGDTDYCDYPPDAQKKTKVGGAINPSLEQIVALRPDLVLVTKSLNRLETVNALDGLGIPAYATDPHTVQEIVSSTERLADVLGVPDAGATLGADLERHVTDLQQRLSGLPPRRVLFIVWSDPLISVGKGTFIADAMRLAGAISIVDSAQDWPHMSLEEVVRLQPEFLVFAASHSDSGQNDFDVLAERPGWRGLDAVRNRRFAVISDAVNRTTPRIVSAIEDLARQLHPEAFSRASRRRKGKENSASSSAATLTSRIGFIQRCSHSHGGLRLRPLTLGRLLTQCAILSAVLFVVVVIALKLGAVPVSLYGLGHDLLRVLFRQSSQLSSEYQLIIFDIRLPRILLGIFVGASLSVAGASFQALLRNPLADPYVLGVSSGAAVGAIIALIIEPHLALAPAVAALLTPIGAFLGAALTITAVYFLGLREGQIDSGTLLLAGIISASFLQAIIMFFMSTLTGGNYRGIAFWMMGELQTQPPRVVSLILRFGFFLAAGTIYTTASDLNLLLGGEKEAMHLGVDVRRVRLVVYIAASLLTGLAVSVSGAIGYVGLLVPHVMRLLFGSDHRILLPTAAFGGAIAVVLADTLARTVVSPAELPVGAMTAIAGAPLFLYLMRRRLA